MSFSITFQKTLLCLCITTVCSLSLHAQYATEPVKMTSAKPMGRGIFYCLPLNGISVRVTIEKTSYIKGIYGDYAAKLLGIDNYIKKDLCSYKIKDVQLKNTVYVDPEQQFFLYSKSEGGPSVSLSPEGILISINDPQPILFKNNIEAETLFNSENYNSQRDENRSSIGSLGVKAPFADLNFYQSYDTSYKEEWIDSAKVLHAILTPVVESKSLGQRAEEIAKLIIESKKYRSDLLSGMQEVNYSPQTIKFMYNRLLKTENEYMESFTGVISSSEETFEFEIRVDTAFLYPLAFFDSQVGLVKMKEEDKCSASAEASNVLSIKIKCLPYGGGAATVFEQNNIDPNTPKGIFYKQPLPIEASLALGSKNLQKKHLFISQWGETLSLPVSKTQMIILNPSTGSLIYSGKPFNRVEADKGSQKMENNGSQNQKK